MMILQQTRGALSSGDQCSLDLPFAATKSLTARIGPTPTFTRASAATFIGSDGLIQTAATNAPRFDHDPVTLACKGLLIEESRTNTLLQSEAFDSVSWNSSSLRTLTVTANNIASPSGAVNADKLTVGGTTTGYRVIQTTAAFVSGTAYTVSCYLKANEISKVIISTGSLTTFPAIGSFDLTGSGSIIGTPTGTAVMQQLQNGWYRCSISAIAGASIPSSISIMPLNASGGAAYAGNNVDSFYAWGAQLEAGSFATSYIPTTTASVIRSADVCTITGTAFSGFYNQPEGTMFADVTPQTVTQIVPVLTVNTTTFNQAHTIFKGDSIFNATGRRWGASTNLTGINVQSMIATSTDVATTRSRLAYAYRLNDMAFAASGSLIGIDTSGTMPSPTAMHIGMRDAALQINGHLASIRYFKKRLANAKLQALTV